MFNLKPIRLDAIEQALEKAHHYRLLNEPGEAESICLDVLDIDPDNQQALVTMLLAMTDRFAKGYGVTVAQAKDILPRLHDDYQRNYYAGLICERQAKALLHQSATGALHDAYEWLRDAMEHFERAEAIRPEGNDESILRWNACARIIMRNKLSARARDASEPYLE